MLRIVYIIVGSVLFVLSDGSVSMHNPFYCYAEDPIRPQLSMFASETPYERIRGLNIDPNVSSCTPSKFWLLGRHGTRLPSNAELGLIFEHSETVHRNILSNYDAGRTSLCAADMALIRSWRLDPNITYGNQEYLTVTGWNEIMGIAQRYQAAFPTLLPAVYSPSDYLFQSADLQGTTNSIAAFADGLFGLNGHQQVDFENIDDPDLLLRPYTNCSLFFDITSPRTEENAFVDGPEYQQMNIQVSSKLGFHASHTLSDDQIATVILLCRFEQIWDMNSASPFCAAFSLANHQVLEYRKDLFSYYRYGYGYASSHSELFKNLPCHLIQDMLHFLRSNDPSDHRATIFSTDAAVIALTLQAFGVFDGDAPLTRHNFAQQTFRQWRASMISPKASNLAVIKYDCADDDSDILFLHNEKPLQMPGCQSNGLCKLSMLMDRLDRYSDVNCTEIFYGILKAECPAQTYFSSLMGKCYSTALMFPTKVVRRIHAVVDLVNTLIYPSGGCQSFIECRDDTNDPILYEPTSEIRCCPTGTRFSPTPDKPTGKCVADCACPSFPQNLGCFKIFEEFHQINSRHKCAPEFQFKMMSEIYARDLQGFDWIILD